MTFISSLILLTIISLPSTDCTCKWFDSDKSKQELFDGSDLVVRGQVIKIVDSLFSYHTSRYIGNNVLLKIDIVYKGHMTSDTLLILQDRSNCNVSFRTNTNYWIYGSKIDYIDQVIDKDGWASSEYDTKTKTFHLLVDSQEKFQLYKSLQKKYYTIQTSQCITFQEYDSFGMIEFLKTKEKK